MNLTQIEARYAKHGGSETIFAVARNGQIIAAKLQQIISKRAPKGASENTLVWRAEYEKNDKDELVVFQTGVDACKGTYEEHEHLVAERKAKTKDEDDKRAEFERIKQRVAEGLAKHTGVKLRKKGQWIDNEFGIQATYSDVEINSRAFPAFEKWLDELDKLPAHADNWSKG